MKKIIVIGCPGSGKSTFARSLQKKTELPLFYLDQMYWNTDKTTVEKSAFLERLSNALKGDAWIIDGNYHSTLDMRLAACDTVFFLDYPTDVCLEGIRARRGTARPDLPWVETEEDAEFIGFIKNYNEQQRPGVLELLEKNSNKRVYVFQNRDEADAFLRGERTNEEVVNHRL